MTGAANSFILGVPDYMQVQGGGTAKIICNHADCHGAVVGAAARRVLGSSKPSPVAMAAIEHGKKHRQ